MPDITHENINLGTLNLHWPSHNAQEPVFEFMQSNEIAGLYAGAFSSFVVTSVGKNDIEELLREYVKSHNVSSEDEVKIQLWINRLPDELVIAERK